MQDGSTPERSEGSSSDLLRRQQEGELGLTSLADRAAGCALGLALGDAAGAPFEFRRARDIPDPAPLFELPWR